jgi:hypothetical protein
VYLIYALRRPLLAFLDSALDGNASLTVPAFIAKWHGNDSRVRMLTASLTPIALTSLITVEVFATATLVAPVMMESARSVYLLAGGMLALTVLYTIFAGNSGVMHSVQVVARALINSPPACRMGSIKQLGHDNRVARQTVGRQQRGEDGGERVSRSDPEQRGECRPLDDTPQQHVRNIAASAGKRCDLNHTPNRLGPAVITAPPPLHDSTAGRWWGFSVMWRGPREEPRLSAGALFFAVGAEQPGCGEGCGRQKFGAVEQHLTVECCQVGRSEIDADACGGVEPRQLAQAHRGVAAAQ